MRNQICSSTFKLIHMGAYRLSLSVTKFIGFYPLEQFVFLLGVRVCVPLPLWRRYPIRCLRCTGKIFTDTAQ